MKGNIEEFMATQIYKKKKSLLIFDMFVAQ